LFVDSRRACGLNTPSASFSFPDVLTDGIRAEVEKVKHSPSRLKSSLALEWTTAAEAVRFAVEEFPAVRTLGAWMQVGDQRYDSDEICRLYESAEYPLRRTLG
jgi:hypothetical protein